MGLMCELDCNVEELTRRLQEAELKLDRAENDVVFLAAQVERHRGQIIRLLDLLETVHTTAGEISHELDS